ncbi:Cation-independent mannose-6-phosphate receptor [Nymphon striatum]|nr:Cation-independent mannose-6-phosphate receptor [Nymphon striatum]
MFYSSAACTQDESKRIMKQVPCYVYDSKFQKRDLSPLIKDNGGYELKTPFKGSKFFINVCSGLNKANVSEDTGAVFNIDEVEYPFGKLSSQLQISEDDDKLTLVYDDSSGDVLPGCASKPKTVINFICPKRRMSNRYPKLIYWEDCNYVVEWITEYACPTVILKATMENCSFDKHIHGIDLDLSDLMKSADKVNLVKPDYHFFIVVFKMGLQERPGSKYSDRELRLIYKHGAKCDKNPQLSYSTVILFQCDHTIREVGSPRFLNVTDCTFIFEWRTYHACITTQKQCAVAENNVLIDLGLLTRSKGEKSWEVLNSGFSSNSSQNNQSAIYLNICDTVSDDVVAKGCPRDSSICLIVEENVGIGLGSQMTELKYNNHTEEIVMTYVGGDKCSDDTYYVSSITFVCKPGDLSSPPVLLQKSSDGCHFQFIWHTAVACKLGKFVGSDCKVFDDQLGVGFDLSPLASDLGYKVESEDYIYMINVCKRLNSSLCNLKTAESASCQISTKTPDKKLSWSLGKPDDKLTYEDGFIYLDYKSGTSYNSGKSRNTRISFVCDPDASIGHPTFVTERNETYIFNWFTSYACPYMPTECITADPLTGQRYVLSQLSGVWPVLVSHSSHASSLKIYLSVCRTLKMSQVPEGCDFRASACMTSLANEKEQVIYENLGEYSDPPVFSSPGHLTLTYDSSVACTEYSMQKNVTISIHFICNEMNQNGFPVITSKPGPCHYMFLWSTSAACPIKELTFADTCIVTDSNSGISYDLNELNESNFYSVDQKYKINICGKVNNNGCGISVNNSEDIAACMLNDSDGSAAVLGRLSSMKIDLTYEQGRIYIIYLGERPEKGLQKTTVIRLICDESGIRKKMEFHHIETDTISERYVFDMHTPLACKSKPMPCQVIDIHGNEYDLTPLIRREYSNWKIPDPHLENKLYHINVCERLVKDKDYPCPDGPIGACETTLDGSSRKGINLGYIASGPVATENGDVILKYVNGDSCRNNSLKRSTKIIFGCYHIDNNPVLLGETAECEYIFYWPTVAACPLQKQIGSGCTVVDPLYGEHYDMNELHNMNEDYVAHSENHDYFINVCGPLVDHGHGNCAGASVCQEDSGKNAKNAGMPSSELIFEGGQLTLKYTGGTSNCHKKYKRQSIISFLCDHSIKEKGPSFITERDDCTYLFEWKTKYACPHFAVSGCAIMDDQGNGYDLSSISLPDGNHYVSSEDNPNLKFVINICRTVVPRKGSVDRDTFPIFRDGNLFLIYEHGDLCKTSDGKNNRMRTEISLICDMDIKENQPVYLGYDSSKCKYSFTWQTRAACPILPETKVLDNCTAINEVTGQKFDLNSLKNEIGYRIRTNDNHIYYINICEKLKSSPCGENSGICQEEFIGNNSWNIGNFNSKLHYHKGALILNYTGGAMCHGNTFQRNAIIEFGCGDSDDTEPTFVSESGDCTYLFVWRTKWACEEQINCQTINGKNGTITDLSSLIKSSSTITSRSSYHTATSLIDNAAYYINVCSPLNSITGVHCPAGAAICRQSTTDGGETMSLGRPTHPPLYDFQGNLILIFGDGSVCPEDKTRTISSVIFFTCNHFSSSRDYEYIRWADSIPGAIISEVNVLKEMIENQPVLVLYYKCVYKFEWETALACPPEKPEEIKDCKLVDTKEHLEFDLKLLTKSKPNGIIIPGLNEDISYELNICGLLDNKPSEICHQSSVCLIRNGSDAFIDLNYFILVSGESSTEIEFICNPTGGIGTPKYWLNVCGGINDTPDPFFCPPSAGACYKPKDSTVIQMLGVVQSQFMFVARIGTPENCAFVFHWNTSLACPEKEVYLEEENGIVSYSDLDISLNFSQEINSTTSTLCINFVNQTGTELQLLLTSTQSKCGKNLNYNVTSVFLFSCSSEQKNPEFLMESKACHYIFRWQTPAACMDVTELSKLVAGSKDKHSDLIDDNSSSRSSSSSAIIISVLVILTIIFLVIVFHKKERREMFASRVRSCFRSTKIPTFHYSSHDRETGDSLLTDATMLQADRPENDSELLV